MEFLFIDGHNFSELNGYYCGSSYVTEHGLTNATLKCREDINCAMVSTLECTDGDSEYRLCEKSTELIPRLEACTLWKKGNIMNIQCSEYGLYINFVDYIDHLNYTCFIF